MEIQNKIFFFLGLIFFYLILFFSTSKPVYFSAYFVAIFFFYLSSKDFHQSLLYSLILSLFSEVGVAGSWFLMGPEEFNLGSGYWISPMTVVILFFGFLQIASILNLTKRCQADKVKVSLADIVLPLFFLWCVVGLVVYPYLNVFYGVLTLAEIIFAFYLMRLCIQRNNLTYIPYILVSMLVFHSLLGGQQILFQRNLGRLVESSNYSYPFGLTATEEQNLFRISAGFGHANMYAVVILALLPFLFIFKGRIINIIKLLVFLNLFFTYSRVAWLIGFPLFFFLWLKSLNFSIERTTKKLVERSVILFLLLIFFLPNFIVRLQTIPQALEEFGSFGVRLKLIQEGLNLIQQFPIFGIGINRFLEIASANSVTGVFELRGFSPVTHIHNLFVEIAAELGIPGLLFFCLYLFSVFGNYKKNINPIKEASFLALSSLVFMSLFHPFFLISQFRLFFLLSAIILAL